MVAGHRGCAGGRLGRLPVRWLVQGWVLGQASGPGPSAGPGPRVLHGSSSRTARRGWHGRPSAGEPASESLLDVRFGLYSFDREGPWPVIPRADADQQPVYPLNPKSLCSSISNLFQII